MPFLRNATPGHRPLDDPGRASPTYEIYEWSFCDGCGSPYPWAGREELISHLINLLGSQGISDHDRLIVTEHLATAPENDPW